ncbi:MAG TPA: hypothetical protein VJ183_03910 [Chloroflexia bacterium]|nr:hypothetical protein [Chloroflexia bacterium]
MITLSQFTPPPHTTPGTEINHQEPVAAQGASAPDPTTQRARRGMASPRPYVAPLASAPLR